MTDFRDFVERLELADGSALELEPWQLEVLEAISGMHRGELQEVLELSGRRHGREHALARAVAASALLGLDVKIASTDEASAADLFRRVEGEVDAIAADLGLELRRASGDNSATTRKRSDARSVRRLPNSRTMR